MRGALSVRVNDGYVDRIVTSKVRDLSFRKTAPGGHASASCTLILPHNTFRDLGPADKLYIYDRRSAVTIWEGYTENPGVVAGTAGEQFDVTAYGGMGLASDQAERLIYIDQALDSWIRDDLHPQAASGTASADQFPEGSGTREGAAALFCQFNPGQPIVTGSQTGLAYPGFRGSLMTFGGVAGWYDAGQIDTTNYKLEWIAEPFVVADPYPVIGMTTTGAAMSGFANGTTYPIGKTTIGFRLIRRAGGATNIATDNVWAAFGDLFVFGHLVDRYGTRRTMNSTLTHLAAATGTPTPTIAGLLASDIAEDLLGRLLTFCDPLSASIDTSTALIDQLAYLEATNAAQVFDDLALHEPDFLWEIQETQQSNGKHRFNYRAWPTTPRYEISTQDGYSAPGGEVDLCNRVAVTWTDAKGNPQTTVTTTTVDALGTRIRDADPVPLPDGRGSLANAQRVGALVLAAKNTPPRAATATVGRPVMDHLRACMVMPWEIEPGYLVRVRETGDDLRLTEMEYRDTDVAATLTLGTPVRTTEELVADVTRTR